jgi:uncharacterized protein (TIGR02646 family)
VIRIVRGAQPKVLARNGAKWKAALLHFNAAGAPAAERRRAENRYRQREVKESLAAMFHDKCAYCESKITHVDYGAIEHYRPKARFPEKTFDWDNLLLACNVCNGPEFKGDRFPDVAEGGPIANPCDDEPGDHLAFVFDPIAGLATVVPKTRRGELTIETLGLNRATLRTYRSSQVKKAAFLARRAPGDPEAQALLYEVRSAAFEYAAFARAL